MALIPSPLTILEQLVAVPSISSHDPLSDQSNLGVLELLAGWLQPLGFNVRLENLETSGKYNLIAQRGEGDAGLVLAGHVDTVSTDYNLWQQDDPFRLKRVADRVYGLGVTDMKGFFPPVITAVAEFTKQQPKKPILILATADEETTMLGARSLARAEKPILGGHWAIIGEPTCMYPMYMHKGYAALELKVQGASGHASDPSLGINAIDSLHRLMQAVIYFRDKQLIKHQRLEFKVPFPTMNFGHIHGGDNINRICESVSLKMDLRLLPGMSYVEVTAQLDAILGKVLLPDGASYSLTFVEEPVPPYTLAKDSPWIRVVEELAGKQATVAAFATEAPFLGELGIDTVILGPGDIDCAHQANEYLHLEAMTKMQLLLSKAIADRCF